VDHFVKEVTNRTEITNQQLLDTLRILIRRHNLGLFISARPKDVLKQVVADFNPLIERNQLIR
jgi:flagellar biosynthesis regulator FlaF